MTTEVPFEWFVLILRIVFIFLLYFFVFQVIRVMSRELRAVATVGQSGPQPHGSLLVDRPGDSQLERGDRFQLDPVTVIGRNRRANIFVESTFVSGEHTQISWEQGNWWATDLHSTNGTFVNSRQISVPTRLNNGDRIDLGGIRFQLVP